MSSCGGLNVHSWTPPPPPPPRAAMGAGQRAKGATEAKHAGMHSLRVPLPAGPRAAVARRRWQRLQRCAGAAADLWAISSAQNPDVSQHLHLNLSAFREGRVRRTGSKPGNSLLMLTSAQAHAPWWPAALLLPSVPQVEAARRSKVTTDRDGAGIIHILELRQVEDISSTSHRNSNTRILMRLSDKHDKLRLKKKSFPGRILLPCGGAVFTQPFRVKAPC